MAGEAFTICPDVYTYANHEHNKLTIEAEIPGVEKKDITVNIHDDSMSLYAPARPRELPMPLLSPSVAW